MLNIEEFLKRKQSAFVHDNEDCREEIVRIFPLLFSIDYCIVKFIYKLKFLLLLYQGAELVVFFQLFNIEVKNKDVDKDIKGKSDKKKSTRPLWWLSHLKPDSLDKVFSITL